MADKSKIEWTDASWNPVTGCSHVSPGCDHCYAETLSHRYKWTTKPWGAQHAAENVQLHPERLDQPLRWKRPRRVFVNSMSDLFHERVPDEFIDQVFAVMALAPEHTFQVLTKRPERMRAYLTGERRADRWSDAAAGLDLDWPFMKRLRNQAVDERDFGRNDDDATWRYGECDSATDSGMRPLPNVWLGVSVEDQRRADERIPLLLETPAAVRFISAEPLLGPIDLRWGGDPWRQWLPAPGPAFVPSRSRPYPKYPSWVIVGGESGPGARPFDVAWAQDIVQQCRASGVAAFVKQLGSNVRWNGRPAWPWAADYAVPINGGYDGFRARLRDRKGGDPSEWPEDLRLREYPR